MKLPWFFATTPAPRVAVPERSRTPAWWAQVVSRYVAWAERSRKSLHLSIAGQ